ncbi:hypothetical protein P22_0229 [Propionispora sp. 2/2-37]|uniref:DNA repair protein RecO n=1 Tax=Propionispora sp. 2/2-37 TaxID=1677858 RepID=UPI0006BB8139|nr:DNA repair protein RecO [Propionispora sp. 2/2-37]CUH94167.1 hypothetical protein P22_0229 [Propionispora sp. 2/2-37]
MVYQTEAILLAVRDWREADRMVTLFSKEYGKLSAVAYGARRPSNRLAGSIQLFSQLDLSLESGKALDTIKQCEMKNSFRRVRENLFYMAYSSFLAEIVVELSPERQGEPRIFELLVDAFTLIAERNPRLVALAAAWQVLAISGYLPEYRVCVECGNDLHFPVFFDVHAGGVLCSFCKKNDTTDTLTLPISQDTAVLIDALVHLNLKCPGKFSVSGASLLQTEAILIQYLLYCLDKPLKSLAFIKQIGS